MFPHCNNGSVLVSLSLFHYIQPACSKSYWTGPNSFPRYFNVLSDRESNWVQYIGLKVLWPVTATVLGVRRLDISLVATQYTPGYNKMEDRISALTPYVEAIQRKYFQASLTIFIAQFPFAASSVMHVRSMTDFRIVTILVTVYSIKYE
jgi:hypothetical protein